LYAYDAKRVGGFGQPFRVASGDSDASTRLCKYQGRGSADAA
jgi:hypothetical protein